MIRVSYWEKPEIQDWYCKHVVDIIRSKNVKFPNDALLQDFINIIKKLSDRELCKILCYPRTELEGETWIREYLKLADFVGHYPELRIQNKRKGYPRKVQKNPECCI